MHQAGWLSRFMRRMHEEAFRAGAGSRGAWRNVSIEWDGDDLRENSILFGVEVPGHPMYSLSWCKRQRRTPCSHLFEKVEDKLEPGQRLPLRCAWRPAQVVMPVTMPSALLWLLTVPLHKHATNLGFSLSY